MAFCVLVIDCPHLSIDQLNAKTDADATLPHEGVDDLANILDAIRGGALPSSVQLTTRDSDPSVSTSGSNSKQVLYNLK